MRRRLKDEPLGATASRITSSRKRWCSVVGRCNDPVDHSFDAEIDKPSIEDVQARRAIQYCWHPASSGLNVKELAHGWRKCAADLVYLN